MPLYEYRCKQCGHIFEKIQSFSAPDEKECPRCAGEVERLLSAPAIQFKGSGFYLTDYGKGGGAPAKDGGTGAGESGGARNGAPAAAKSSGSGEAGGGRSAAPSTGGASGTPASGSGSSGSGSSGGSSAS